MIWYRTFCGWTVVANLLTRYLQIKMLIPFLESVTFLLGFLQYSGTKERVHYSMLHFDLWCSSICSPWPSSTSREPVSASVSTTGRTSSSLCRLRLLLKESPVWVRSSYSFTDQVVMTPFPKDRFIMGYFHKKLEFETCQSAFSRVRSTLFIGDVLFVILNTSLHCSLCVLDTWRTLWRRMRRRRNMRSFPGLWGRAGGSSSHAS